MPQRDDGHTNHVLPPTDDRLAGGAAEVLTATQVYTLLSHSRRRYLCYALADGEERRLGDIAERVAAWERDQPVAAVTSSERERVYTSLYHVHVPKLAAKQVTVFDSDAGEIRSDANIEQVLLALEAICTSRDASQETHARRPTNAVE